METNTMSKLFNFLQSQSRFYGRRVKRALSNQYVVGIPKTFLPVYFKNFFPNKMTENRETSG